MVTECTAKALTHRITKFKNLAKENSAGDGDAEKGATGGKKAAAAPKGKGKGGKAAKKADTPVEDGDDEEVKPKKTGGKRKKAEMEGDEEVGGEKVKVEADADGEEDAAEEY